MPLDYLSCCFSYSVYFCTPQSIVDTDVVIVAAVVFAGEKKNWCFPRYILDTIIDVYRMKTCKWLRKNHTPIDNHWLRLSCVFFSHLLFTSSFLILLFRLFLNVRNRFVDELHHETFYRKEKAIKLDDCYYFDSILRQCNIKKWGHFDYLLYFPLLLFPSYYVRFRQKSNFYVNLKISSHTAESPIIHPFTFNYLKYSKFISRK